MNVGVATGEVNPNSSYFNSKGMWLTYVILVTLVHFLFLSFPFFTVATAWTVTNVVHNVCLFFLFHIEKGTPFETADQGKSRQLTQWEQFDHGENYTDTKKFLTVVPVVLFFLASFYSKYDPIHFVINAMSLVILALVPKLPQLYKIRLFGINKY